MLTRIGREAEEEEGKPVIAVYWSAPEAIGIEVEIQSIYTVEI